MKNFIFILAGLIFSACAVERADSINYMANLPQNAMIYVKDSAKIDSAILSAESSAKNAESKADSAKIAESTAKNKEISADSAPQIAESTNAESKADSAKIAESKAQSELKKQYLKKHFSVWSEEYPTPKRDDIFWAANTKKGFDETKRAINEAFFDALIKSMNIASYPSMRKKAIMVKTTNMRALPTNKPRFSKNDGFPFDRWQNSLIFAYTPILVLHSTENKEWFLVQSSFVAGWVKADEVAFMGTKEIREMQNAEFLLPMRDNIALHHKGQFLQNAFIGMLLQKGEITITSRQNKKIKKPQIIAYKRDLNGNALKVKVDFEAGDFVAFPLPFSEVNIAKMITAIGAQNYGWGGMYDNRDCSSFIRDVFANVGIWLPRNSKAQVLHGQITQGSQYLDLPKDNDAKLAFIAKFAKPFRTIIWLKGHIMLYVGAVDGTPIVAHQVWGISGEAGSEILGGVSITTLTPQIDINSPNFSDEGGGKKRSLLDRIEAINIIK
ncbi:SH3 domain-containing protein [Helicobacter sp. 23-1044]